jgi:hypothetical protein
MGFNWAFKGLIFCQDFAYAGLALLFSIPLLVV